MGPRLQPAAGVARAVLTKCCLAVAARHYLRPDGTVDAEERQRTLAARGAQIPLGATGRPAGR